MTDQAPGQPLPLPPPTPLPPSLAKRDWTPWIGGAGFLILAAAITAVALRPDPDMTEINQRIAGLEHRPDQTSRLDALEHRPTPDIAGLRERIAVLETHPAGDPDSRILRLSRLLSASLALQAGRKLGDIPGAPASLTRFANLIPPTEAALRLAYPAAERAALDASRPADDGRKLGERLLARIEDLVTVRQGDHVLIGDPAAGVLARARTALNAGDLTGAINAVNNLHGPAAAAMAGWMAEATALRDARAALADMAQP